MGCHHSKTEPSTQEKSFTFWWRKRNKVVAINVPLQEKVGTSMDSGTSNATRKTEQMVLIQLKEGGIVPKKGEGGVAFILEIGGVSDDSTPSTLPGAPEYDKKYPQYTTYSTEACRAGQHRPPRRLPPINKAAIDKKQERARLNRERKTEERRTKWAKSYARVQSTIKGYAYT
ncbi:uncharacterized protein LOC117323243 [Pecten maximus]|uniref:uncharacterized protein LOC117323243 n=1 Tax=Pecten maximus TaxID=6579 RepID=UPI001458E5EE|nr:uncharacterized protein LOC117323243 [Pecten maximus]